MPETRTEWLVLAAGVCVLGVLAALIVLGRGGDPKHAAAGSLKPPAAAPTTTTPTTTADRLTATITSTAAAPTTTPPPTNAKLVLVAARGDSWFEIRSGSATGRVLFSGTLPRGQRKAFSAPRLWASIGGGANLDARLGGRPLRLPFGTYTTVIIRSGLTPAP